MIGSTLNARYRLERELGQGGMGSVFRATDLVLGRGVAIKILRDRTGDEVASKLRLEAQILARLEHGSIVRIYDFGEHEGLAYFVMEEVQGSNLHRRLRSLPISKRLAVLAETADALSYAHQQGVIHRDIKPANILLTPDDRCRLSDFGLSVLAEEQSSETRRIRGTPTYMSPEQAKGRRLDHRTDLYSLGVILYEALTGDPPFSGPPLGVVAAHASSEPDRPSSRNPLITSEFEAFTLALLAKDPAERPPSGVHVARELRALIDLAGPLDLAFVGSVRDARPEMTVGLLSPTHATGKPTLVRPSVDISAPTPMSLPGELPTEPDRPVATRPSSDRSAVTTPPGDRLSSARAMFLDVVAEPVVLTPVERYLTGHYLAYLLGGARRKGLLGSRPLDEVNADRARLLLAMSWLTLREPDEDDLHRAGAMLDDQVEVRPLLNPVVVVKYLAQRAEPAARRRFRRIRKSLQSVSKRASEHLTDAKGTLNPGLMPQKLDDLRRVAPEKSEVDDELVSRWNRVSEAWRGSDDLRTAVLRYATKNGWKNPASLDLWPEVVYPLIERARRQRRLRSVPEAILDTICGVLHIPDSGIRLDRAIAARVPIPVIEKIDLSVELIADEPVIAEPDTEIQPRPRRLRDGSSSLVLDELAAEVEPDRLLIRLVEPDPIRVSMDQLHQLWREAMAALQTADPRARASLRHHAVGPYRLSVVASTRGRNAGQVVLQGMPKQKQIEMLTPSLRVGSHRPAIAVWVYRDNSLAIAYVDFRGVTRYISWHAPTAVQTNYEDPAELTHDLYQSGLETPDQLGVVLTKRFKPKFV
ncbi:MAG: serine/threonine-protein kinase [Isosphaeraceae bacterium]|nr:serine/threonine-protein kinase [Isosphaeraceae bacterium]